MYYYANPGQMVELLIMRFAENTIPHPLDFQLIHANNETKSMLVNYARV